MARIEVLHEISDGALRSAAVRLASGRLLKRPVSLLKPHTYRKINRWNHNQLMTSMRTVVRRITSQSKPKTTRRSTRKFLLDVEDVVLAKVRGYPIWPAVTQTDVRGTPLLENLNSGKRNIPVKSFQTSNHALVPVKNITAFKDKHKYNSAKEEHAFKMAAEWIHSHKEKDNDDDESSPDVPTKTTDADNDDDVNKTKQLIDQQTRID